MKKVKYEEYIIIFIALLMLFFVLRTNFKQTIGVLLNVKITYFVLAICFFGIYFLIESFVLYKIIHQYKKEYKYSASIKLNAMTKFFNGITPFASGGQPLQVYELSKDDIKPTNGTLIVVEHFLIFQSSIVLLALLALLLNNIYHILTFNGLISKFTIIGFILNIGLLLGVILICISKKICQKIGCFIINVCGKLKLIKNTKKVSDNWIRTCDEYYNGFIELKENKILLFKLLFYETLALFFMLIVPYMTFKALNTEINLLIIFVLSTYVFFVGSFFPVPGGSGGTEYAFVLFFINYVASDVVNASLLLWRFVTYYLPVIIGAIIFSMRKIKK